MKILLVHTSGFLDHSEVSSLGISLSELQFASVRNVSAFSLIFCLTNRKLFEVVFLQFKAFVPTTLLESHTQEKAYKYKNVNEVR